MRLLRMVISGSAARGASIWRRVHDVKVMAAERSNGTGASAAAAAAAVGFA